MDLATTVAAPFVRQGRERLGEGEFVVALSLDRDWFSPDQAKQVVERAVAEGLLERVEDELRLTVDADSVTIPDGAEPNDNLLQERSPFERILDALLEDGLEKREAVAGINELQSELAIEHGAAAVLYARRRGVDVDRAAAAVRQELSGAGEEA